MNETTKELVLDAIKELVTIDQGWVPGPRMIAAGHALSITGGHCDITGFAPGIEPPVHYWVPSIAPSGLAFVTSERYPGWKGSVLVGALKARARSALGTLWPVSDASAQRVMGGFYRRLAAENQDAADHMVLRHPHLPQNLRGQRRQGPTGQTRPEGAKAAGRGQQIEIGEGDMAIDLRTGAIFRRRGQQQVRGVGQGNRGQDAADTESGHGLQELAALHDSPPPRWLSRHQAAT